MLFVILAVAVTVVAKSVRIVPQGTVGLVEPLPRPSCASYFSISGLDDVLGSHRPLQRRLEGALAERASRLGVRPARVDVALAAA